MSRLATHWTIQSASTTLRVHNVTIRRLILSGEIKGEYRGGRWIIPVEEMRNFIGDSSTRFYTPVEIEQLLLCSKETIKGEIAKGALRSVKVGKLIRVSQLALDDYMSYLSTSQQ
ncbi:MAG: helix-turn-helix domain-containing protein [Verrucomicrobiales bacterium]|nr:helix-turn-helix domain-containing protein [Verrucomicrobiales bacterium]